MAEAEVRRDIPQHERDSMDASDFAGKDKSFPINKPEDVAAAAASIGRAGPDNYDAGTLKANIIRIARKKGAAFVAELPKAWQDAEETAGGDGESARAMMPGAEHAVARVMSNPRTARTFAAMRGARRPS
jgi:hypothetical protein